VSRADVSRLGLRPTDDARILRMMRAPQWIESSAAGVVGGASATPHTKGAWTQMIASTAADSNLLHFAYDQVYTLSTDTSQLLDIGIGAAGAETVLVANCGGGYAGTDGAPHFGIPVSIPKGSRLSFRNQALIPGDSVRCYMAVWNVPNVDSPRTIDTYGADTAVSGPTVALTSNNTYYQITAATTQPYQGVVFIPGALPGATGMSSQARIATIAMGAAGAEVELPSKVSFSTTNSEIVAMAYNYTNVGSRVYNPFHGYCPGHIPAGSRLAVKLDVGAAYVSCYLLGVPYR